MVLKFPIWLCKLVDDSAAVLIAPGISASPSEDNLRYFNVMILGPQQSPYEGTQPCLVV